MFNRSLSNANSFDAPDAQVWVTTPDGAMTQHLGRASTGGGDSWPKWAQIVQLHQGHSLMWFTFSSRRAYGLRKPAGDPAQIWMAAFDPTRADMGLDPSYPAFWLPFQEPASGNHIAQWTLEVERQPCITDGECPTGEFCEDGVCVPVIE
jgi:TolB protein